MESNMSSRRAAAQAASSSSSSSRTPPSPPRSNDPAGPDGRSAGACAGRVRGSTPRGGAAGRTASHEGSGRRLSFSAPLQPLQPPPPPPPSCRSAVNDIASRSLSIPCFFRYLAFFCPLHGGAHTLLSLTEYLHASTVAHTCSVRFSCCPVVSPVCVASASGLPHRRRPQGLGPYLTRTFDPFLLIQQALPEAALPQFKT